MSNIIAVCIRELLSKDGYVYIPALGQFDLRYHPAKIDAEAKSIQPPHQSINFSDAKLESTSLEKAVAKKSNTTADQAKEMVLNFSNEISNQLVKHKEAFVAGLGTLLLGKKNKISLDQSTAYYNKSGYGLNQVSLAPIDYTLLEKPASIFASDDRVIPVESNTGSTGWRIFNIFLAALLLFILLLLVRSCSQYLSSDTKPAIGKTIDNTQLDGEAVATSELKEDNEEHASVGSNSEAAASANIESEDTFTEKSVNSTDASSQETPTAVTDLALESADFIPADGCIIIVGVYKNNRNVVRMQDRLIESGYNVHTEISPEGLTRVGFKFECQDVDLREYIRAIRKSIHKNSWYLQPQMEVY